MADRKLLAFAVMGMMLVSSLTFLTISMIPQAETHYNYIAKPYTVSYPNSDVSVLWVRRNGTDPYPFDFYGGANVSPSYGMNYFGTNVLQVTWDYTLVDMNDTALFPLDCEIYVQVDYSTASSEAVADYALNNSRIRGSFIDDFQVGLQSPANMSAIYTAIHHNDGALSYDLTLGIIVYNRNYMNQNDYIPYYPYDWYEIANYFDIIHFWYYPFTYQLLYNGLIGYEDDFLYLHGLMPGKEYWLGIYLHYYNIGSYSLNFTAEEMAIAGKLIKEGYATRYSLLENFWIQHNRPTADLIKDFINDEIQMNYSSTWYLGTQTVLSYQDGNPLYNKLIDDIWYPMDYGIQITSWVLTSSVLQNMTVFGAMVPQRIWTGGFPIPYYLGAPIWEVPTTDYILYNMRTGDWNYPFYYDATNERASYILQPDQTYRMMNLPLTPYSILANTTITTVTTWDNLLVTISAMVEFNNTNLTIKNSIVQFANPVTNNSMYYHTIPWYGLKIGTNDMQIFITDTIIEPKFRAYPYYFNRPYSAFDDESSFMMTKSVLAGYSYHFHPAGHVWMNNNTFFQVQPLVGNYPALWLETPSYIVLLHFNDNIVWNWVASGVTGVFLMPYNLPISTHGWYVTGQVDYPFFDLTVVDVPAFTFNRNTIVGGNYGLWIDMAYSDSPPINDITIYSSDSNEGMSTLTGETIFTEFRVDGSTSKMITIHTHTIFDWSVKSSIPGPIFVMYYPYLRNGIYVLTVNGIGQNIAIDTGSLTFSYSNWSTYRDNFTLELYSMTIDTESTIGNLLWLIFIFIAPITMAQIAPKMGFIFGMVIMLLIAFIEDFGFLPYMFISLLAIVISVYKSR